MLHKSVLLTSSHIENSFDLTRKLSGTFIVVDEYFELVSFDVASLFTNVPINLALVLEIGGFILGEHKDPIGRIPFGGGICIELNGFRI